jgi:hypothetical protein
MNTDTLKQAANEIFADAVRACSPNGQQSRRQAAAALVDAAKARGFAGPELRFVASCGMAWFGYGGGL